MASEFASLHLSVFGVPRRVRIVAVAVGVANLAVRPVDHQFALIATGDRTRGILCGALSTMIRDGRRATRLLNSPAISRWDNMYVLLRHKRSSKNLHRDG